MKTTTYFALLVLSIGSFSLSSCKNDDETEPDPIASFSFQNDGCKAPCNVSFSNTSENASSYQWDFGDGSSSTERSPTHEYTESGDYTVKLTASSNGGASTLVNHKMRLCLSNCHFEGPTNV